MHRAMCLVDAEHGVKKTDEILFKTLNQFKK